MKDEFNHVEIDGKEADAIQVKMDDVVALSLIHIWLRVSPKMSIRHRRVQKTPGSLTGSRNGSLEPLLKKRYSSEKGGLTWRH